MPELFELSANKDILDALKILLEEVRAKEFPLLVTAIQAAELTGYGTERRFRYAVERGIMPQPYDTDVRPMLWSRAEIEARLPSGNNPSQSPGLRALNKRFGIK